MNTGQMLLSLGALILLSTMILRFNRAILTSDEVMYNSKFNVLASSLCTSLIEEARGKAFDQKTDSAAVSNVSQLSATLGPDFGESYEDFNDFDDFNGYVKVDSTMPSAVFYTTSKVTYIEATNPIKITTSKTWHKMITVTVMSSSMKDPVQMSSTYSYWFFR
jgi:MSHA pilin protein MshD